MSKEEIQFEAPFIDRYLTLFFGGHNRPWSQYRYVSLMCKKFNTKKKRKEKMEGGKKESLC